MNAIESLLGAQKAESKESFDCVENKCVIIGLELLAVWIALQIIGIDTFLLMHVTNYTLGDAGVSDKIAA